ncbi:MAG: hypothetical protein KKA70_11095 [Proteobacteria bacterium]|nr:hypothetical protein [Pseudomonadota bacterium]
MEKVFTAPGLLLAKKLSNNITVTCFDESKHVAADRWRVKVRFEIQVPLDLEVISAENKGIVAAFIEKNDEHLVQTLYKERHFIPQQDVEKTVSELIDRVFATTLAYFESKRFPVKYIEKAYAEFEENLKHLSETGLEAEDQEDEGPADFSHCFRD